MKSDSDAAKTVPSLLSSARDLTFILAILAFFAGFEYRAYYYGALHVPLSTFSIVDNQILVGSYSVFWWHRREILDGFLLLVALALASDVMNVPEKVFAFKYQRLILVFIISFFPILNAWAREAANLVFLSFVDTKTGLRALLLGPPWVRRALSFPRQTRDRHFTDPLVASDY